MTGRLVSLLRVGPFNILRLQSSSLQTDDGSLLPLGVEILFESTMTTFQFGQPPLSLWAKDGKIRCLDVSTGVTKKTLAKI